MKLKLLLAVVFFILAAAQAKAQSLHFGVEAGGTSASFSGTDASQITSSRFGLMGGAFASLGFGDLAIQPEVFYIRKGGQTADGKGSFEVDYIEVPILAKFYLGVPILNPALLIGPYAAFNTLAQAQNGVITNPSSTDWGGMVGAEISVDALSLSARWELSLTNTTTDTNIQNRSFDLLLGYSFF
jgi:hypothetical protein